MNILYVIGNGFDLWHGLPTSYSHFHRNQKEGLDSYSRYFSSGLSDLPLWHNFEEDLGTFDWESFYEDYNYTEPMNDNFRPSEAFGLEDELSSEGESIVIHFENLFQEWIESITVEHVRPKFSFVENSRFLTFNYTPLLNTVYNLSNDAILHIHGCLANNDPLIFGHGSYIEEEPEFDREGNSNRHMFSDAQGAAKYPLYKFKKQVAEILSQHGRYFDLLSETNVVIVLGHSLNDIDLPYFQKILAVAPNSYWLVCKHPQDNGEAHLQQLVKCGIPISKIKLTSIEEVDTALSMLRGLTK